MREIERDAHTVWPTDILKPSPVSISKTSVRYRDLDIMPVLSLKLFLPCVCPFCMLGSLNVTLNLGPG